MRQKSLGSFRENGTPNYITNVCQSLSDSPSYLSPSLFLSPLSLRVSSAYRIILHQKRIINDSRDARGSHKSGYGRASTNIYIIYFFSPFLPYEWRSRRRSRPTSMKRVKFKLILYLRQRVGHSTSFADPFVFVTARPLTPLSAYKSFRQVGNKRRVLMDLRERERGHPSIFPLSFNSFCSRKRENVTSTA